MSKVPRTITTQVPGSPNSTDATKSASLQPLRDKTLESHNVLAPSHDHSPTQHKIQNKSPKHRHDRRQQFNRFSSVNALYHGDSGNYEQQISPREFSGTITTSTAVTSKISNTHHNISNTHHNRLPSPRLLQNSNASNTHYRNNSNSSNSNNSNNNENNENSNTDKDTIFQLQLEIESLRQRLKIIDTSKSGSTSKEELLDLIDEKESIIQTKTDQVNLLSEKFQKITKAVSRMEHDASSIRERNAGLEADNKKIQRHLAIREKEVDVLVARCAAQEDKLLGVKDAKILEREVMELTNKVLKKEKAARVAEEENIILNDQLGKLEDEKGFALEEIEEMTTTHDGMVEEFQRTIATLELRSASEREDITKIESELERVSNLRDAEKKRRIMDEEKLKRLHEEELADAKVQLEMQLEEERMEFDTFHREAIKKIEGEGDKERENFQSQLKLQRTESEDYYTEAAQKMEAEREEERDYFESQLKLKEGQIENLNRDVADAKENTHDLRLKLEEAITNIDELTFENEDNTNKFEMKQKELEDQIDGKIAATVELNSSIQQLRNQGESYEKESIEFKDKVEHLESQVKSMAKQEEELKVEGRTNYDQITQLCEDIKRFKNKELEYDKEIEAYEGKITQLDNIIKQSGEDRDQLKEAIESGNIETEKANAELENLKLRLQTQTEMNAIEVERLEESIRIIKSHNESKVEEIQNTNDEALKKANDKIVELTGEVAKLQRHMERTEMEAAEIVNELTGDISKHETLEAENEEKLKKMKYTIEDLNRKLQFAEVESTQLKDTISTHESESEVSRTKIESLSKLRVEQEENLGSCRSELEMLIGAYDRSKKDSSRKLSSLQNEIKELETHYNNEATKYTKDYAKLQELTNKAEERVDQHTEELARVQKELEAKTRIVNDMVKHSEASEKDQELMRKLVTELQDENESFLQETGLLKAKYLRLEKELEKKGKDHFANLQEEILIRQGMESTISRMKAENQGMKEQCKGYTELEARNFLLEDKVERQENYLKKKLQEQSRKNHPFGKTPSPMRHSISNKRRDPSPARHSICGQRAPPLPRSTHSSVGRRRSMVKGGDELDQLLGDV